VLIVVAFVFLMGCGLLAGSVWVACNTASQIWSEVSAKWTNGVAVKVSIVDANSSIIGNSTELNVRLIG
jgi:hypothetical protein